MDKKEIRKIVEPMITMAAKEKDNFETVTVKAKVARRDKDGKRMKQIIDRNTGEVLSASHRDKDGKLIGLLGPSGCGKSTALNLISGLLKPTDGRVFFGDEVAFWWSVSCFNSIQVAGEQFLCQKVRHL